MGNPEDPEDQAKATDPKIIATGSQLQTPKTSTRGWLHTLSKEALQTELKNRGLEETGKKEELLDRLQKFLIGEPSARSRSSSPAPPRNTVRTPTAPPLKPQKWGVRFTGYTDPVAFLERLEEIKVTERISSDCLLPVLPEILADSALLWFRNNRKQWENWEDFLADFRRFYLPADYESNLEDEISQRRQQPNEYARTFLIDIQTLIRRHGSISPEKELFWIHRNLLPDYQFYIPRYTVKTVRDLLERIKEYEALRRRTENVETNRARPEQVPRTTDLQESDDLGTRSRYQPRNQTPPVSRVPRENIRNPQAACWKCGNTGHFRADCTAPPVKFCSRCGHRGVFSRDCPCPARIPAPRPAEN